MTEEALAAQVDENMPPLDETISEEIPAKVKTPEIEEVATPEAGKFVEELDDKTQARVNRLTFKIHEQERRAIAAEKALEELQANNEPPEQSEPKLEDFDFDDAKHNAAFIEFHSKKAAKEAISQSSKQQQQDIELQRQLEINRAFNTKVDELKLTVNDYDQLVSQLTFISADVHDAIMQHDKGPQLAYYLGKHLDVAESIDLMKLGEISAQLANVKPINKPSAAPNPIKPVKPGGSLNKSMDEMSMDEIYAIE